MNYKMLGRFIAQIVSIEALFLVPALLISLGYGEMNAVLAFAYTLGIMLAVAGLLYWLCHGAGKLFGSVTNQEIADALKASTGITLDKRKIVIADQIKNVGTYTVTCKLGYEISAPLTVKIEEA